MALSHPCLDQIVNDTELSVRALNCLKNADIKTIGDLTQKTEADLLRLRGCGKRSVNEIREILIEIGLDLRVAQVVPAAIGTLRYERQERRKKRTEWRINRWNEIEALRSDGTIYREIATRMGISIDRVKQIRREKKRYDERLSRGMPV